MGCHHHGSGCPAAIAVAAVWDAHDRSPCGGAGGDDRSMLLRRNFRSPSDRNWLLSELAIAACDLAEVLGSAVALNLLFHIPLLWAVIITGLDVLLLLLLQQFGMRMIEALVVVLVGTIAVCYFVEIFVLPPIGTGC